MARKKKSKVNKKKTPAKRSSAKVGGSAAKARRAKTTKSKAGSRRPRKSREAIIAILEEAKSRGSNAVAIRKHKLSATTFYSWKRRFAAGRRKRNK